MKQSRFGKPNMTNLPPELGRAIISQIMSTPKPDYAKMQAEAEKLEREILKAREKKDDQGTSGK